MDLTIGSTVTFKVADVLGAGAPALCHQIWGTDWRCLEGRGVLSRRCQGKGWWVELNCGREVKVGQSKLTLVDDQAPNAPRNASASTSRQGAKRARPMPEPNIVSDDEQEGLDLGSDEEDDLDDPDSTVVHNVVYLSILYIYIWSL